MLIALSAEISWGLWGAWGDRANTPKLSARLPHWWHVFSLGGLCWSCAHPCASSTSLHHGAGCRQMGSSSRLPHRVCVPPTTPAT